MNNSLNIFVVLGPPGSGKGTQSALLAKKMQYEHIVMGDLVRAFISGESEEARKAKQRYDQGIPQPDELATELLRKKINTLSEREGLVLDTFPLSVGQAQNLEELTSEFSVTDFKVVFLNVEKEEVVKRITGRKICSQCKKIYLPKDPDYNNACRACGGKLIIRSDDKPEVAARRFDEYEKRNAPIKDFYREKGVLVEVNGQQSIEAVHQEILQKLNLN